MRSAPRQLGLEVMRAVAWASVQNVAKHTGLANDSVYRWIVNLTLPRARPRARRERVVAAIEHKRGAGMSPADAARDYLRDAAFTTLNRFGALKMLEARVKSLLEAPVQSGAAKKTKNGKAHA